MKANKTLTGFRSGRESFSVRLFHSDVERINELVSMEPGNDLYRVSRIIYLRKFIEDALKYKYPGEDSNGERPAINADPLNHRKDPFDHSQIKVVISIKLFRSDMERINEILSNNRNEDDGQTTLSAFICNLIHEFLPVRYPVKAKSRSGH